MSEAKEVIFCGEDGKIISSKEAFDLVYSGLEDLLEINNRSGKSKSCGVSMKSHGSGVVHYAHVERETKNLQDDIRKSKVISKFYDELPSISARIDNKKYAVYPAPIYEEMFKKPDILFIKDCMTHGTSSSPTQVVRRLHKRDLCDYELYECQIEKGEISPLPEELILVINERLLENNIPPITYKPSKKWKDNGLPFVLRNFYSSIKDTKIQPEGIEVYTAILAELGILSAIDDKSIEYMTVSTSSNSEKSQLSLINVDLDFCAIATKKDMWGLNGEVHRIYHMLSKYIMPSLTYNQFRDDAKEKRKDLRDKHGPVLDEIYANVVDNVLKEK